MNYVININLPPGLDLGELNQKLDTIIMKQSEIAAAVAEMASQSQEAFAEITNRILALEEEVARLIEQVKDPAITDTQFLANMETLKTHTKSLADLVQQAGGGEGGTGGGDGGTGGGGGGEPAPGEPAPAGRQPAEGRQIPGATGKMNPPAKK